MFLFFFQTDNGPEFRALATAEFIRTVPGAKLKHIFGRPFTPEDQGVVEAYNHTILRMIR